LYYCGLVVFLAKIAAGKWREVVYGKRSKCAAIPLHVEKAKAWFINNGL